MADPDEGAPAGAAAAPAPAGSPAPAGGAHPAAPPAIDVQKLADRVYQLMQADLRLARARGQSAAERARR